MLILLQKSEFSSVGFNEVSVTSYNPLPFSQERMKILYPFLQNANLFLVLPDPVGNWGSGYRWEILH